MKRFLPASKSLSPIPIKLFVGLVVVGVSVLLFDPVAAQIREGWDDVSSLYAQVVAEEDATTVETPDLELSIESIERHTPQIQKASPSTASIAQANVANAILLNFPLNEDFNYPTGNLEAPGVGGANWSKENVGASSIVLEAQQLTVSGYITAANSLNIGVGTTYDYLPLGGNEDPASPTAAYDPIPLQANVPFYYGSVMQGPTAGAGRIRAALRIDDGGVNTGNWIRLQARRDGGNNNARLGLGGAGSNHGQLAVTNDAPFLFVIKGVWDGNTTITYQYAVNPDPVEAQVAWSNASTSHTVAAAPQIGRLFIGPSGTSTGARLGYIRVSETYGDVVVDDPTDTPPTISDETFTVAGDAPTGKVVGTVDASDDGTISYAITNGNTGNAFDIDSNGEITVAASLNNGSPASYSLEVTVTDDATPVAQTAIGTITVNVTTTTVAPTLTQALKINFQDNGTRIPPTDYLVDFGEPYAQRSGTNQGGGIYTYGWVDITNLNPEDLTNQGRFRGNGVALELSTTTHMDHPATPPKGFWEIALPNGDYQVLVSVGDASAGNDPEVHRINAEGVNIINNFAPSGGANSATRFTNGSGTATVADGKLTIDYLGGGINTKPNFIEITPAGINLPPEISPQAFTVSDGAANNDLIGVVSATDDNGVTGFLITSGDDNNVFDIDASGNLTVSDASQLDFCTTQQYTLTVEVSDAEPLTASAPITINVTKDLTVSCSPVSPLACADVVVNLPVSLDFNGGVVGTIEDANCVGTGFTAVLEHSEARRAGDLPISFPTLNGYEPSLLDLSGGTLTITSQAGISFLDPPASMNNNNQVNSLGVGFDGLNVPILIKATIASLNLGAGNSAQQAGIWFGFDEDNFVKLDVNNQGGNVELRVESGGASTLQLQDNGMVPANSDVILEMDIDPGTNEVEAFYTVGTGARTSLGTLAIPASYFTGRDINNAGGQDNVSFAGIFTTHRNGSQFTASFDEFSVESTADVTPPVITLVGDNPQELTVGDSYVELGASATDDIDGDITGDIVIDASAVDINNVGSYNVTYNVSDAAGNAATEVIRTVNVNAAPDVTPPVISLLGDNPLELTQGDAYVEAGATASDNIDGDISGDIVIDATAVDVNTLGSYQVTYDVSDAAGNSAVQVIRTVNVNAVPDNIPPVISLLGANPLELTEGDAYVEAGATASDDVDGDISGDIVIDATAVNVNTPGSYQVTYDVSDAAGNPAVQVIRTVNVNAVPDNIPPVISLLGANPLELTEGDAYVEAGATASDDVDGDISGDIVIDATAVDVNTPGSYSVTYDVSDAAGNSAVQVIRTVNINSADVTPPVITLLGDNPLELTEGDAYVEAGATASDNVDGDISGDIVIDATAVDVNTPGSYQVTYDVSDAAGNPAFQAIRTVNVNEADVTPPVISLLGDNPLELTEGDAYVEAGATASDDVDGDISGDIIIDATAVDVNTTGSYQVTYDVSDAAGNPAVQVIRTVNVNEADVTPPVISLLGDNPLELTEGDAYVEAGATASDDVDGDISGNIVIDATAVDVNTAGSYQVTYDVSDAAGNPAVQVIRTVNVNAAPDVTAPVITLLGDNPLELTEGDAYVEAGATASDDVDGDISGNIVIDATAVDVNTPGSYSVTYDVSDAAGNSAVQVTRTVNVNAAPPFAVNINFQDAGTTPPAGYLDDHGQPYGLRTEADQGSSTYTYGWISIVDGTPEDLVGQGRNRNFPALDLLQRTTIHMEHPSTPPTGFWEIEVENGLYQVTVGVGDASGGADPEVHRINAEGVNIVDDFEPSGANGSLTRFSTGSGIVEVTDGKLTLDYLGGGVNTKPNYVEIAEFTGNVPPTVANEIPDQTAEANVAFNFTVPASTFEDLDDPSLTLTAQLDGNQPLPSWLGFDGSAFSGTPTSGDLGSIDVEVIADDGDATVSDVFTITVFDNAVACSPISTLPCDDVAVSLPFSLDFNAEVVNTLFDTDGQGIGFTMVDPPEVNQFPAVPSNANVPGYEPSLIDLDGGNLTITSTKGINFQKPPTSQNNNTQVNALGVGAELTNGIIDVSVDLAQPDFASSAGNSSQQGGLWFGLDEDNYIKLVVSKVNGTTSKAQLLIESIDPTDPTSVVVDELNSANFAINLANTINLRLELDPINETVAGFFATNGGAETQLENGTLEVPTSFFNGVDHDSDGGTNPLTFAGVFTTHRNAAVAASVDFSFDNFSISQQAVIPALTFTPNTASETLEAGASGSFTSDLGVNDGTTPTANLSVDYNEGNNWVQLPNSPATLGTLSFGLDASALVPGTYTATVTASEAGYVDATLDVTLTVSPTGGPLFDILVNFQDAATTPPVGYIEDHGQAYANRTEADQGGGLYTYGWITEASAGTGTPVPLDLAGPPGNGRNRNSGAVPLEQGTIMHMQYNDVNGTNGQSFPGAWEFEVPNGTYQVLVNLGDPDGVGAANPENYDLSVEGTKIIDDFAPGGAVGSPTMFTSASLQVEVTDGRVTIDAQGGTNTKITWVQITQVNVNPALVFDPTPNSVSLEVGETETIGNFLATNDNTDPQNATVSAVDDNTNAVPTWLSLDGNSVDNAPFTTGSEISFEVDATGLAVGTYTATVTASATGYEDAVITLTAFVYVQQTPQILSAIPADNSIDVLINTSVSSDELVLPNPDDQGIFGINNATITNSTVRLRKVSDNSLVPATVNGTGGGDGIRLTPSLNLESNTTYQFEIDGVEDLTGVAFASFTSTFTTGTDGGGPSGNDLDNVSFTNSGNVASGNKFTTLTIGPDGKLYGLTIGGNIHRWDINADGTLANEETLTAWKSGYNNSRTAIGFTFDPDATSGNLIAYITHMSSGLSGAPIWDGKISRLTGPNLATEDLVVTNLPRSIRDHLTNSIAFKPGENNVLYFLQGSNSAGGAPDGAWGNRPERLLSAACLRLDLDLLPENQWPLDAQTSGDVAVINAADVNSPTTSDGFYNPYFINAPLTGYGWGIRNAYDLVWHTNGQLYIPTNGTAGGSNSPASVDGTRRPDGTFYNHVDADYPVIPAANSNNTQRDWLFRVNPVSAGGYYGHPNPLRGQFVMNRGSLDVNKYPAGVQPDIDYRGAAFDFEFNKSPNGVIEYRSNAENGNLQGAMLVCRYSGGSDLIALVPDGPDGDIQTFKIGIPGFTGFNDPLDLVEDLSNGNIYVSDYGASSIVLLKPSNQSTPQPVISVAPDSIVLDQTTNAGASAAQTISVSNTGNADLTNVSINIIGEDPGEFQSAGTIGTLGQGQTQNISVTFDPTSNGPKFAQLEVSTTQSGVESGIVELKGLGKTGTGGANEPSLQWIVDTWLGEGVIDVGDDNPATNVINGSTPNAPLLGDEVSAQIFQRAVDAPVTLQVLSVYGPTGTTPIVDFGWYEAGNPNTKIEVFNVDNTPTSNGQTLTPEINGQLEFDPGLTPFGFYNGWLAFGPDRILYSEDNLNTFTGALPHHIRVYPIPGEENAYLIATEEHITGNDFQDVVVIARNVTPFVPGSLALTFSPDQLDFIVGVDGTDTKTSTLTANGPLSPGEVTLISDQPWVVLPNTTVLGSPMDFGVDASGLGQGNFTATVTASAPNFADATIDITLSVTEEIVWTYQVNFQDESVLTAPVGYLRDIGEAYGLRSDADQGDGTLTYGWVIPGSTTPLDATPNGRVRTAGANDLENSIILMDHPNPAQFDPGDWLIDLPNGTYYVNAGVGDPDFTDSNHDLEANGVEIVTLIPGGGNLFAEGTAIVNVTNGTLRLSQGVGGNNTKIAFVRIAPFDPSSIPPSIQAIFIGNETAPDVYAGSVTVELIATDNSGSGILSLEYSTDGTNFLPYTTPLVFDQVGPVSLSVRAEDNNNNIANEVYDFSIAAPSGALIALENMTKIPGTDIGFPTDLDYTFHNNASGSGSATQWHDTGIMRIHNDGVNDLVITGFLISDETEFTLPNGELTTPPAPIAPGEFYDLTIEFIETAGAKGVREQTLTIQSNADNGQDVIADLRGGFMIQPEGGNEITAQQVVQAFGYLTNLGPLAADDSDYPDPAAVDAGANGDLVLSELFVQADLNEPVMAIQMAAFKGGGGESFALIQHNNNNTVSGFEDTFGSNWHQSLLPKTGNNTDVVTGAVVNVITTPLANNAFRIRADGQNTSGSGGINGATGLPNNLGIRTYKLVDKEGNVVPNAYIVIQDYIGGGCGAGSANCDWNDNVYAFFNIRPEGIPTSTAIADANAVVDDPFAYDVSGSFDNGYAGNNLTYSATLGDGSPLPTWLSINPVTGELTGTPPFNTPSPLTIEVTVTDDNGLTASESFNLDIDGAFGTLLVATPTSLDFGLLVEGDAQATLTLTLENAGPAGAPTINITNLDLSGVDAALFSLDQTNTDLELDQGESTTLDVIFDPATVGIKEALLAITNDFDSQTLDIPLAATVQDACEVSGFAFDGNEVLTDPNCNATDGSIQVGTINGTGIVTYTLGLESNETGLFENLAAGTYTVQAVDENGCDISVDFTLVEPSITATYELAIAPETCEENDGSAAISFLSGDPIDFSITWSDGQTGPLAENLTEGTYTATITEIATGCSETVVAEILKNCGPVCDPVPAPWTNADIGGPAIAGEVCWDPFAETFEVKASGADIWTTSDQFHYVSQPVDCDVEVIAFVESQSNTDPWAKAGVMIRESSAANSAAVMMVVTPQQGANFQHRPSTGAAFTYNAGTDNVGGITAPYWVRITRSGNTFTGFISADASDPQNPGWVEVSSITVNMATNVLAGLAVTSHDNSELSTVLFSNVSVSCDGNTAPTAVISAIPTTGDAPLTVQFDGSGSTDTETPEGLTYLWQFGDPNNTTSTLESPSFIYLTEGDYTATLTVEDPEGETAIDQVLITVTASGGGDPDQDPIASAGGDIALQDFDNSGSEFIPLDGSGSFDPDGGNIVSYVWSEDGNTIATGVNPVVEFSVGVHVVLLTVTDDEGMTDTDDLVVTIDQGPSELSALRLNSAGPTLTYIGNEFIADASTNPLYFDDPHTFTNSGINAPELYHTERGSSTDQGTLTYDIPVANGTYTVRTHHAELWFGYNGPAGAVGNRVFDIFIEGNLVQDDFDMYAEGVGNGLSSAFAVLEFPNIEVTDGTLTIFLDASANRPSIAGIEVIEPGEADTEAPSVPDNVVASNETETSFDLSWDPSTDNVGVTGYLVYINVGGQETVIPTSTPSVSVPNLDPGTSYLVGVSAVDAAGNESDQSQAIVVSTEEGCGVSIISETPSDPTDCGTATGSIAITANGENLEYNLNGGAFQSTATFSGLTEGTYTIIVREVGDTDCQVSTTLTLNDPESPVITSAPATDQSDCEVADGAITINAIGTNLEYSIGGAFQTSNTFTGLAEGTYTITVRNAGSTSCVATSSATVGKPANCEGGGDCTTPLNLALNQPATQSSVKGDGVASFANDGNTIGDDNWGPDANMMHTDDGDSQPWWTVNLGQLSTIETVVIFNRTDTRAFILNRLSNFYVYISDSPIDGTRTNADLSSDVAITNQFFAGGAGAQETLQFGGVLGQYVMIKLDGSGPMHVAEIEVYGCDDTTPPVCDIDLVSVASQDESECGAEDGSISITASGTVEYSIDGGSTYQASNTFNGLDAGSYTVTIRKIGQPSCTEAYSANPIVLVSPAGPSISSVNEEDESDCGAGDGSITINSSDSNLEYSIDGGNTYQGGNSFTGLTAGSYNVVIRQNGDGGCSESYGANPVIINAPSAPSITDVASTDQTDCEVQDGTITVTASGTNLEYSIGGAFQPGNSFSGLAEGTYTITVRDAGNTACVASSSTSIGKPANCESDECTTPFNLALNKPASQSSVRGDGVPSFANDGNTTGDDNWGADANMMHTDNGDTQPWWAVDLGTVATLQYVDIYNRTDTRPFILGRLSNFYVHVSSTPIDGSRTNADLSSDPSITSEFFSGPAGQLETIQLGGVQGQYVMIKLDGTGPLHMAEVEVYGCDDTPPPVCDIVLVSVASTNESDCGAGDGSITINATGNVEYSINGGSSYQASNTFNGLSAGTYNVVIRKIGLASCIVTGPGVVIQAPAAPSITDVSSTDQTDCEVLDGTITVTAVGTNLEYSIGAGFQSSNTFSALAEGTYTVTVRDALNTACEATSSATVGKPAGCEDVCTIPINLALEPGAVASQSATYGNGEASFAIDGNTSGNDPWGADADLQHTVTAADAWLKVDLGQVGELSDVTIYNRSNPGLYNRLNNFFIFYSDQDIDANRPTGDLESDPNIENLFFPGSAGAIEIIGLGQAQARYVVIKMSNILNVRPLHIAEIEISGCPVVAGGVNSSQRLAGPQSEVGEEVNLSVFPNPYRDNFTLEIEGALEEGAHLLISNALGQTISRMPVPASRQLELGENLTMGVYWIQLFNGDSVKRIKVMKAR